MSEERLREQLYGQIKNRAMMYYHIFNQMRREIGEQQATAIMKRGIYNRGLEIGRMLAEFGPDNLEGLKNAFVNRMVPDDGRMFKPEVCRCDEQMLEIKMHCCPLKDAYLEAGIGEEDTATMLNIAAQVDYGTFEGAGFSIEARTWQPGKKGCCRLHITPGS